MHIALNYSIPTKLDHLYQLYGVLNSSYQNTKVEPTV